MTVPETDGARGDGPLVVIPCLNEAAHIRDVLETVLRDPVATSGLVVIADGGSTDGTQDVVRSFMSEHACIRLLDNPKRIQSAGVNLAVRRFGETRRWLVRLDAHSQYPENYVGRLIEVARATGAGSVVVAMQSLGNGCFQRAAAAAQNSRLGTGGSAHRMGAVSGPVDHGHHALMSLPLFAAVGGYDEHMATNEDAELDVRLAAQGALIWLSVENAIGYYPRATALRLMKQYFRFGVGRADTVTRHRLKARVRQLVMVLLAPAVLAVALAPVLPMALETFVLAPTLVWAGVSLSLGIGIGVRSRSLCAAGAGPAAMIMHLSWSVGFWWFLLTRGVSRLLSPPSAPGR